MSELERRRIKWEMEEEAKRNAEKNESLYLDKAKNCVFTISLGDYLTVVGKEGRDYTLVGVDSYDKTKIPFNSDSYGANPGAILAARLEDLAGEAVVAVCPYSYGGYGRTGLMGTALIPKKDNNI